MVNLSSGDMTYNIPLMDVGGYPLNISYNSGVGTDQEATWVGLGWNLSVGQINRNVRGIPDDFDGDQIRYENHMKPNITVGANFQVTPNLVGIPAESVLKPLEEAGVGEFNPSIGLSVQANNYTGFSIKPSIGASIDIGENLSVGMNIESSADGLSVSPSLSAHTTSKWKKMRQNVLGLKIGTTFNSRAGLSHLSVNGTMRANRMRVMNVMKGPYLKKGKGGTLGLGSSVSFTDQLYTPSKRTGMVTASFTGNLAGGTEIFGVEAQGQITAHGTVTQIAPEEENKLVHAYGYANTENADEYSILDFNREKDGPVSINTTNLALTNYTYDTYNVSGQGVSGMYRPYRNQVGYVYDPVVNDYSTSGSLGIEIGTGNLVHFGIDYDVTTVNGQSGVWNESTSNPIRSKFEDANSSAPDYEKVHYKNVGDLSVDRDWGMFDDVGRYQPVRVNMVGQKFDRRTSNQYMQKIAANGNEQAISVATPIQRTKRQLRNQAIVNVTKGELKNGVGYGPLAGEVEANFPDEAEDHHVNEVQILRNDGARYVYGQPAYSNKKVEATFSVANGGDCSSGLVQYTPSSLDDPSDLPNDQYLERITTPGYVHTHLLTSILSTDYVDRTGDGPSADDFGSYTKFTYDQKDDYKWRTPYIGGMASYNEGLKTDDKDDKGNYVYGEKEIYLIKKIETKTHIAIFDYSARKDAKGVQGEQGGLSETQNSYKLDKISLYSIEEYDAQNPSNSTPIKVVHFEYSYSLCTGVPNNNDNQTLTSNELSNFGGKLTLKKIYFTYRNSYMGKYTGYRFNYNEFKNGKDEYNESVGNLVVNNDKTAGGTGENPDYNLKAYDSWGNYQPNNGGCGNTAALNAAEFPYTSQVQDDQNLYSSVWHLKKIHLPSGGDISIEYESDDYSSVQDRSPQRMFMVKGAGDAADGSGEPHWDRLYSGISNEHRNYLYVEVDNSELETATHTDLKRRYFTDIAKPVQFRFLLNMTQIGGANGNNDATAKFDYVSGYFEVDSNYELSIFEDGGQKYLSIPMKMVKLEGGFNLVDNSLERTNPIAKAGWQFGRTYLNNHVYSQMPNGDVGGAGDAGDWILDIMTDLASAQLINNLVDVFKGPNGALERKRIARRFNTNKSWVRLQEPTGTKLGGGSRVKSIKMSDVWEEMNTGQSNYETMEYGQEYTYTLDGTGDGVSSGVATYEPVGNSENPFVQPVFSTTDKLLAPDVVNYTERPFGESFFPSPTVTYARVQVKNITAGDAPSGTHQVNPLHKTGMVVSEFYTTKDYPTYVDFTHMHAREDNQEILDNILSLNVRKHFTATQGYSIHLNDMNGKEKAQWVYAEGQDAPISGVEYIYDNYETPGGYNASMNTERMKGKLDNFVRVINADGSIQMKTIGVEVDIVNDFRQNKTKTVTAGINTNVANFLVGFFPAIVPIPLPDYQSSKDQFRSVSTTKVINTFGILKETIAHDAGASVKTRNLAWDANTGEVLVTETVDEYNDKYYTFNYPAHWYYRGMGQATQNLGIEGTLTVATGGYYVSEFVASQFLIAGDEVYLEAGTTSHGWVSSVAGQLVKIIDENGDAITGAAGDFKVIRSGRRNLQSAGIMNVTLMKNPLKDDNGAWYTTIPSNFLEASSDHEKWKIINAGAVDYSDYWKPDCECGLDLSTGTYNPYVVNERGVWRTKSSRTYLTGRNSQNEVTPRQEGFMTSFSPMYQRIVGGNWSKDLNGWTFVAEVSKYSPYGFELENVDALDRYSAAQYGYNHTFPMAVGANTQYREIGFDGFEDYGFDGCDEDAHFNFEGLTNAVQSNAQSHTGKYSLKVGTNKTVTLSKIIDCSE